MCSPGGGKRMMGGGALAAESPERIPAKYAGCCAGEREGERKVVGEGKGVGVVLYERGGG